MKSLISFSFVAFLSVSALSLSTHAAIQLDTNGLSAQTAQRLQSFVSTVEAKLPQSMKQRLSTQTITVRFAQLDNQSKIVIPECSSVVASLSEAAGAKSQYAKAKGKNEGIRYNFQTQSVTNKNTITLNSNFINVILSGESAAQKYACDHKNTYRLAEGSLINGLARIYDNSTAVKSNSSQNRSEKTTKISEGLRYKYISGWDKKKLQQAFWPRAVNPYEFAGDSSDHFASNMEFFLLDSEYACRRPLAQDYLSSLVGADPFAGRRNCEVNTEIKIPSTYAEDIKDEATDQTYVETKQDLTAYDLNPDSVYNVYYMKASAGGGFGFGHSMFRVVVCPPNMSISKSCEKIVDNDLVFNPRANANEMRLDNMRGLFGGYPSQFLVNNVYDLAAEYGDNELRHLYNMPLGYRDAQGQFVDVMPEDQKRRFIWATLESFWSYYGNYKFISNNCADEAMRLYQMSSTDEDVLNLGVLKPNDINKKLHKLGYIDETEVRKYEKTTGIIGRIFGRGKIKNQKEYDERRAAIEEARHKNTFVSKVFDIEDAVRAIMRLEGNPNPDFKTARKEVKKWMKLAVPDYKWDDEDALEGIANITEEQKEEIYKNSFYEIQARYERLMSAAKTQKEQDLVVFHFYRVIYHIYNKRIADVSKQAVQTAYAVAYPSKDRNVKEMPKNVAITKDQFEKIRAAVDQYSDIQAQLMPYREASTKPGYGIPLKSEVTRGQKFIELKEQEGKNVEDVIVSLVGLLGPEHLLLQQIKAFHDGLEERRDEALARGSSK